MTILDRFRLDGRVAILTGASSGLGVGFAAALAEAGADLALGARRADRLAETCTLVENTGRHAIAVRTNVADPDDCTALVDAAMTAYGRVDILVNNAGVAQTLYCGASACPTVTAAACCCYRASSLPTRH